MYFYLKTESYLSCLFDRKMKYLLVFFTLSIVGFTSVGQTNLTNENFQVIRQKESKIKGYSDEMINGDHWFMRFTADSLFIRGFVNALKIKHSFSYPFDSITSISKLYAPDSSFRIFTWQMMRDYTFYRQRGAIQMRTEDGSLKLFPLFDASDFTSAPNDSIRDTKNWIGAIYYKILLNMDGNKKVYTLLGFDENGPRSNKKWMEILTFDEEGKPQFGGNYFKFEPDTAKHKKPILRFNVEYKKEAKMRVLFDKEEQMIIYDHLVTEQDEPENLYTYVPDGSYEGFKWKDNHWEHIAKLATQSLGNGNAPMPNMLLDLEGNIDQKKLEEMSKKNLLLQEQEEKASNNKKVVPKKNKKAIDTVSKQPNDPTEY